MTSTILTAKGQTTIPKKVRKFLDLHPGDHIEFIIQSNGKVVIIPATVDISELQGILPKPKKAISLNEMDKAIRSRAAKKCKE